MVYDPMEELRSALADRYRIESEAGRGGMATVYKAEDLKHQRTVAIKVLSADLSYTIGAERFQREIHIAARLQHPHILPVFDSGEAGGLLYYVMPFVEGESLRDRLARESQLPLDDTIGIAIEIAGALSYAHGKGIVHRDIKPENVLIEHGHAVVADFGIAHAVADSGEKLTATGISVGTASYMSPEQFAGENADARSDIYSLGCMLYEMLVGEVPFSGPNLLAIMARHTMEEVPSITLVRATVPPELENSVYRALEKTPADRFQTMEEFRNALLGGTVSGPLTRTRGHTARYAAMRGAGEPAPRPWYRTPGAITAAVIAILAIAAAAAAINIASRGGNVPVDANKVAVLYFDDRSENDSLRYLADALTESIIDQLTDAGALTVISRAGVEPFRDADVSEVPRVAQELGVGSVVRGTVEARGDGIQVRVALLDASGDELEGRTFRHASANLLALRDSVGPQVGEFLRQRLGQRISVQERRSRTGNLDAWVLAQRAEQKRKESERLFAADSAPAALQALSDADSLLRGSEQIDARWPDAPALRARVALHRARSLARADRAAAAAAIDSGMAHANRALDVDPRHADALEMRGTLRFLRIPMGLVRPDRVPVVLDSAEQDLLDAVRWRPTQATAWATLSSLYYRKPDVAEAKNAAVRAYNADAYLSAAPLILERLFWTNYDQELFAEAVRWCGEGHRRLPEAPFFYQCQLWLQTAPKGVRIDPDRAWALRDSLVARSPARSRAVDSLRAEILVAGSLARATLSDSARAVLGRARSGARSVDTERVLAGDEAVVRVILGDHDEAVRLIKEYLSVHPDHRSGFASGTVWWWRDLQGNAEFRRLVQASR